MRQVHGDHVPNNDQSQREEPQDPGVDNPDVDFVAGATEEGRLGLLATPYSTAAWANSGRTTFS